MSELEQNPSPQSGGQGVFEGIRGAKSRDPEVTPAPAEREATAQVSEAPSGETAQPTQKTESGDNESEVRLRQRTASLERKLAEMGPWAQVGIALRNDPNGEELLQRLQRGEPILAGSPQDTERGQPAVSPGLSREELTQTLNEREAIKRQIDDLTTMAEERLPHYSKIKKSPQFIGLMDAALAAQWNGSLPLHPDVKEWSDEQASKNYTALALAHEMYLMRNPKVQEAVKEAGKKEERERAGAALAASVSSGTSTSTSGEDRKQTSEEAVKQRMLNARGVGKSFAKAFG